MPPQPQKSSPAGKVSVACPHCLAEQMESVFAKSTICRACGRGFEIGKTRSGQAQGVTDTHAGNFFLKKLHGLFHKESIRRIVCYGCGAQQQVSSLAKSSLCPHCGGYIDLRDFKITTGFSRNIQTQGMVHVTRRGDLTSTKVACAEAYIRGGIHGSLHCTGTARFKMTGRVVGQLDCNEIVIERRSDIEFVRPLKARTLRIAGKISASVNVDAVVIENKGCLEGTVYAKSIVVDKGGIFHGELYIGKQEMVQAELLEAAQAETFAGMKPSLRKAV